MNWDQVKGSWKQFKGKAREQWGEITDDELDVVQGKQEQFEGLLQKKLGCTKEEAKKKTNAFIDSL